MPSDEPQDRADFKADFKADLQDGAAILRSFGFEPDPVIEAYKNDVDRTLLRENLRRTPEQRLDNLMELQRFADEMRRAGRVARSGYK
jgi:hypothetical protein